MNYDERKQDGIMKRIVIFSGNRAEFGILFPLIYTLHTYYRLEIILSGAHVLKRWATESDVKKQLQDNHISCHVTDIPLSAKNNIYTRCLGEIYDKTLDFFETNQDVDLAVVLGDRIETAAFALGAFYSRIPLLHICGGDVADVFHFDTNIRHSITKLANYHFATNERSKNVLLQMGEEKHRVFNIGNLSYDYDRLGFLTPTAQLAEMYKLTQDDMLVVFTYHPTCDRTQEENYKEFKSGLEAVIDSDAKKIIVTFPNNDPGHELIFDYIMSLDENERMMRVNSLGTYSYLSLMKNYRTIIVGNSSSGLLETTLYCVPVLNVGERQNGRVRGDNVTDVTADYESVKTALNKLIQNYDTLRDKYTGTKYVFGDGRAAIKAKDYIDRIMERSKEERLFKKFVERQE